MRQGRQRAPFVGPLLLILLILWTRFSNHGGALAQQNDNQNSDVANRGDKKFGDRCIYNDECGFEGGICDERMMKCQCRPDLPITNHLDKCGTASRVNESCTFNEQCETVNHQTECKDGVCICRYEKTPVMKPGGNYECILIEQKRTPEKYVDPAMIGILVAMFLMFITICVVLRLFSRARWRENRTIFNTPNPRLMNVSLLRENKLLHQERRGSRGSARGPSRQPSMASLRAHSPNSQGSRRGSRGSSNASAASTRSNKSPPQANMNSATTPMLESVTVEVQEPKA
ncbi:uncharacterized protein LOC109605412 isoform X2 [Aethina tumida]|uniref:uncharacterized protein LOC109605412 isoform X2 n=1 Tax=Aethina tumida TaxID=116153 RepID=UPI00214984D6|nr:uncharacterized protein LOC109605412 isoform X2 [Aethina tumida]